MPDNTIGSTANQPEKRHTTTHDRYSISDCVCGLVCTRTSLKKALASASAHKLRHPESPLIVVEVFDLMARRDCAQLWNHDGDIISFRKDHENPQPESQPVSGNLGSKAGAL